MKVPALALSLVLLARPAIGATEGIEFFEQKVRPVLIEHCYSCHSAQAKKLKANLYLDSRAGWQKGGDSGDPAIIPGKPEQSPLIRSIQHLDDDLVMPPKKPKLPENVIADLVTWVKMGAPDPRDGTTAEAKRGDKSWWSLQPIARTFPYDNIDGFIGAQLAANHLSLNPPADPRSLIRRMSYDVIGLPPTPDEVNAFVAACQVDRRRATEDLVDRLLASPHYGERWGRHWLDVIRFGESNGFERNFVIDDLWPFRDYVIKSFNDDKPFNQFITEHLAGDVIGRDQPDIEVGSAFLVAGPYDDVGNQDPVAQKNIRAATLDDIITATGGAFLGLTVNCARCHNHKFDPIASEDYYRLRAAFEGVTHGRRVIATAEQRATFAAAMTPLTAEKERLTRERADLEQAINARASTAFAGSHPSRPKIDPDYTEEHFPPVLARQVRFVMHASISDARTAAGSGRLTEFEVWNTDQRNVALAANGGRAEGARSAVAEDFPEAYGPQFCIDGKFGEQWFIGSPAVLTITLARAETIDRIAFSNSKERGRPDKTPGGTPCEYEVQVSLDGQAWQNVADSRDRIPWTPEHGVQRLRRQVITPEERDQSARLDQELALVQSRIDRVPALPQVWAGKFSQPKEPTFLHKGGDPMKPGDVVPPAGLGVLDEVIKPYTLPADAPEGERRRALAAWITRDDNPLTPRVLVNRLWQHHFGTGLVDTPSDFGFLGSKPTHPELLDYLASRLLANGWRIKALHREILLSQAYLQSSAFRPEAAQQDKDARLLWRFPPRRLSAEEIRDTMLAVAGKLQLEPMGGPGFRLYKFTQNNVCTYFPLDTVGPETYRRAVYHQNARASVVDVLNDFDLPDIAFAAPKRANTTTPLQALTLLNHRFTLDLATALTTRCQPSTAAATTADATSSDVTAAMIGRAYALAFQRPPTPQECAAATKLIAAHGFPAFCRALLNSNELIYLD